MSDPSSPVRSTDRLLGPILCALLFGTATGLFFGERIRPIETAAEAFVKLLQMTVLPYVTVSIIGSLGALRVEDLRVLGVRTAVVIAGLWAIALAFVFLTPMCFPPTRSGSFFSTTLLEQPPPLDLVDLYIPRNPFFALANNIVPAVVLFSLLVGAALIGVPRKQPLLDVLQAASDTLSRTMQFVVRLMPYGVYAIAAATAGTLRLEQASRLQVYVVAYGGFSLVLALWVLPGLVGALTPISRRHIFAATHGALLTAFVAGDLFIVLPMLIEACKTLVTRYADPTPRALGLPDIVVPVSFNFPHSGKILSVSFILFAAWLSDVPIDAADYSRLGLTALVTLFGSVTSAMPFLLDLFRLPADTFQLFVASGIINSRFGTLVAAVHTVAVALLGTCAVTGVLRWRPRDVARYVLASVAITASVVFATRLAATALLANLTPSGDVLASMTLSERAGAVVYRTAVPATRPDGDRLDAVVTSGMLRVGYLPDALPFAFFNGDGELVGFDAALMHLLARELGVGLEFVRVDRNGSADSSGAADALARGYCDIVIGGLAMTTARAAMMRLSTPYLDETLGFVVPDASRRRFDSWDKIRASVPLTIIVPDVPYYVEILARRLPSAHLRRARTVADLFGAHAPDADAWALPAERGSAWTLRYPQYAVVVPSPGVIKVPLAFAMPRGESPLETFVNTWLDLKRRDGTLDELYRYWILGRESGPAPPRWSVLDNVLHWVE